MLQPRDLELPKELTTSHLISEEEFSIIKEHTIIGANILKNISLIDHVQEIVRNHHERYDGNGYPDGLKGKEIPLHARIVTVADS